MVETVNKNNKVDLPDDLQVQNSTTQTAGEKRHDFRKYKLVNLGLNWVLSVAVMDLFLGSSPKEGQEAPTSWFASIAPKNKFGDAVRKGTDGFRNFYDNLEGSVTKVSNKYVGTTVADLFSLNVGGHLTAVALYFMDQNNEKSARNYDAQIDKKNGHTPSAEEISAREARYEVIRNTPTKTAWQVFKGRIGGMLFNMGFYSGIELIDKKVSGVAPTGNKQGNTEKYGLRRISQKFANAVEENLGDGKENIKNKRLNYWAEVLPFDLMCTWSLSSVMEKIIKGNDHSKDANISNPTADAVVVNAQPDNESAPTGATNEAEQEDRSIIDEPANIEAEQHASTSEKKSKQWMQKTPKKDYQSLEESEETLVSNMR